MATSAVKPPVRNDIELGPVTHWPTVYAAAGVAAAVIVGLVAVVALAPSQTAPAPQLSEPVAEIRPAPPPRPVRSVVKPAEPVPAVVAAAPAPQPVRAEPPSDPTPAPAPVATALPPVIRPVKVVVASEPIQDSPAPPSPSPQRSVLGYEFALLANLRTCATEIDLNAVKGTSTKLLAKPDDRKAQDAPGRNRRKPPGPLADPTDPVVDVIAHRPDLAGLPVRGASECRASDEAAESLGIVSAELRGVQAKLARSGDSRSAFADDRSNSSERIKKLIDFLSGQRVWLKEEYVPALTQMLCAEVPSVRLQLTKMLADINGRKAGIALARQALFDPSPDVREAAVQALKDRRPEEYRRTLLDGFRHPWAPVADHAAEALTALDDRGAVQSLEAMLDLPDPAAPALDEKKHWVKAELVKVNHLRNCLLCHAPSSSADDPVRGFVPKPGEPLPVAYYANPEGDFVRADVTYLRQDFSVLQAVPDPGKWPEMQRFDYLVRSRELTEQEIIDMADSGSPASHSYPQRAAVQFALEKLAAKDADRPPVKPGLGP